MAQLDPVGWFRSAHPEQGSLRVQVSSGRELFPVPGAEVEVYRDFGTVRETFHTGVTDSSGIVEGILLPALPAAWALHWPSSCSLPSGSGWTRPTARSASRASPSR